jgi:hypothetical protein
LEKNEYKRRNTYYMDNKNMTFLIAIVGLVMAVGSVTWGLSDMPPEVRAPEQQVVSEEEIMSDLEVDQELYSIMNTYQIPAENPQPEEEYDVVVTGGEPEGVAAAVAAARNGAETLLIEERGHLGGVYTYGNLNFIDLVYDANNNPAVEGIFQEWHALVGGEEAFDIELGKTAFYKLVEDEPNLTLLLETEMTDVDVDEEDKLTALTIQNEHGSQMVEGERFIDTSRHAETAVRAGVSYREPGEDMNMTEDPMAVTYMIRLSDVEWGEINRTVQEELLGIGGINQYSAWGFNSVREEYEPVEDNTRIRGLNINRNINQHGEEEYFINALQLFDVEVADETQVEEAKESGRRETDNLVEFLRERFPGFENASVIDYPEELYVRETRHVESEYMMPMADLWTNRDHWDGIGYGGYAVDVQARAIEDYSFILADPAQYSIPFRSLVPLDVENLAVASQAAGYSSLAAGSTRITPTAMASAEGAGTAAAISIEEGLTFREMSNSREQISALREQLSLQGAKVEAFNIPYPYEGEYVDEALQYAMNYAIIVGGYENELPIEEDLGKEHFANLLYNGSVRALQQESSEAEEWLASPEDSPNFEEENFDRNELAMFISRRLGEGVESGQAWNWLHENDLIDDFIYNRIDENRPVTNGEGYYIAVGILQTIDDN